MENSKIDLANNFWYAGEAWGKFYSLEELANSANPKSRMGEQIRGALADWSQTADVESAIRIVQLVIECLLGEHLPESSNHPYLARADWVFVSADTARQQADQLAKSKARANGMACEPGVQAAEIFKEFSAKANISLQKSVTNSNWIDAVASINDFHCALYFEAI